MILELLHPKSVVDLGCGTGAWLAELKRQGVSRVLGVDGAHIPAEQLEINVNEFLAADVTKPLPLGDKFDLAMSLEVAEHLAEKEADAFTDTLAGLAPVVLFSAAIPFQGGEHHVNEQWPKYWVEKFKERGFLALDPFRHLLWERSDVDWWYAQNLVLFVQQSSIERFSLLQSAERGVSAYVHPRNYLRHAWEKRVLRVAVDLATVTRAGDIVIIAEEGQFGSFYLPGRMVLPFLERSGHYFGPPRDGKEAIAELERMKDNGATYLAFGWPAFWWLQHYKELVAYLEEHHLTTLNNENVVVYSLQPPAAKALPAD
jgi:SAM-dependent methyltransferase